MLSANRRQDKRSALHTMIGSLRSRMAIFLFFFWSKPYRAGTGSRMDTDVDLEV